MKYRAEVDGLRALAVLPVIFFHAGFEWFRGGFVGVDIFFVISGYLITSIIISEMTEDKFSIASFYERRARRILPALFFMILICIPFAWLWLTPDGLKDFGESIMAVLVFSSNILFWSESGYFDTVSELKPLLHTWSLAVEEQYYILFPVFMMLTWRFGLKWVLFMLAMGFIASLSVAHWGAFNKPTATFYLLPTRAWELLVGVFVAFYLRSNSFLLSHIVNQMLSLIGLAMIIYSMVAFDDGTPFPSLYALVPTIGTGLVILSATPNTIVHRLLSFSPIVAIGLISYSTYLWHQPLLAFARHRLAGEVSDISLIMLCVSSLVMGYISWRWIEKPFRDKRKATRKFIFRFSSIGIFLFGLVGFSLHFYSAKFSSFNPLFDSEYYVQLNVARINRQNEIKAGICQFNGRDGITKIDQFIASWNCMPESITKETIMVIGDSVSADVANSFRFLSEDIIQIGGAGCSLYPDYEKHSEYCAKVYQKADEIIKKGVKKIVLANRWNKDELTSGHMRAIRDYWSSYDISIYIIPPPLVFHQLNQIFFSFNDKLISSIFEEKSIQNLVNLEEDSRWYMPPSYSESCSQATSIYKSQFCDSFFQRYDYDAETFLRTDDFHLTEKGAEVLSVYLKKYIPLIFSN